MLCYIGLSWCFFWCLGVLFFGIGKEFVCCLYVFGDYGNDCCGKFFEYGI